MLEVLKQMVEALETYGDKHRKTYLLEGAWDEEITKGDAAIQAGKQAIKELESQDGTCQHCAGKGCVACDAREQEPVACKECHLKDTVYDLLGDLKVANLKLSVRSQRTWVGLTDEEIAQGYETTGHYQTLRPQDKFAVYALARAIEAKLKEKNNG